MNYSEFKSHMVKLMSDHIGDSANIQLKEIQKNNGIVYDGMIVNEGFNISPTFYLNPYYHRYLDGVALEEIDEDILASYSKSKPKESLDISFFTDFDKVKNKIVFKLVSTSKNAVLLEDVPHIDFLDLSIIFVYAICCDGQNFSSILIHNQHLNMWNQSKENLLQIAGLNTPLLLPATLTPLDEVLKNTELSLLLPDSSIGKLYPDIYVSTNKAQVHGAGVLLYENFLEQCASKFDSSFIIIPSSIHETLLIPYEEEMTKEYLDHLSQMVQEVNETEVVDEEILSDHVYFYDKTLKKIIY